ncbi:hypothetical protein lerEdw1_004442 [Lerista edwardsae]|nr:hypothetical protein lerEdw1_004442 [Lerista edwardsae]
MIISTWTVYLFFRKAARQPLPSGTSLDEEDVSETEILTVLEHWLRKSEDEASKLFRQKSENRTEGKCESKPDLSSFTMLKQEVAVVRSASDLWDPFEERRSAKILTDSLCVFCSHTRVYRVSSDIRKDAMQERVEKVRNSISRVMFHADSDSDTDLSNGYSND